MFKDFMAENHVETVIANNRNYIEYIIYVDVIYEIFLLIDQISHNRWAFPIP